VGWTRDIDNHQLAALNALVMDFALPLSLFVATASTPRALLLAQWPLLVVLAVSMLVLVMRGLAAKLGSKGMEPVTFQNRGDRRCRL
jgi:malonate transporter